MRKFIKNLKTIIKYNFMSVLYLQENAGCIFYNEQIHLNSTLHNCLSQCVWRCLWCFKVSNVISWFLQPGKFCQLVSTHFTCHVQDSNDLRQWCIQYFSVYKHTTLTLSSLSNNMLQAYSNPQASPCALRWSSSVPR